MALSSGMEVIVLTTLFSVLFAALFLLLFLRVRQKSDSCPEQDALMPLEGNREEMPRRTEES